MKRVISFIRRISARLSHRGQAVPKIVHLTPAQAQARWAEIERSLADRQRRRPVRSQAARDGHRTRRARHIIGTAK